MVEKIEGVSFKEWISELKNEECKQTRGALYNKDDNGYCCLGVYASLCGISNESLTRYRGALSIGEIFLIESDVISVLAIDIDKYQRVRSKLAELNDTGHTFEQIADLLIFYCWINGIEQDG